MRLLLRNAFGMDQRRASGLIDKSLGDLAPRLAPREESATRELGDAQLHPVELEEDPGDRRPIGA